MEERIRNWLIYILLVSGMAAIVVWTRKNHPEYYYEPNKFIVYFIFGTGVIIGYYYFVVKQKK